MRNASRCEIVRARWIARGRLDDEARCADEWKRRQCRRGARGVGAGEVAVEHVHARVRGRVCAAADHAGCGAVRCRNLLFAAARPFGRHASTLHPPHLFLQEVARALARLHRRAGRRRRTVWHPARPRREGLGAATGCLSRFLRTSPFPARRPVVAAQLPLSLCPSAGIHHRARVCGRSVVPLSAKNLDAAAIADRSCVLRSRRLELARLGRSSARLRQRGRSLEHHLLVSQPRAGAMACERRSRAGIEPARSRPADVWRVLAQQPSRLSGIGAHRHREGPGRSGRMDHRSPGEPGLGLGPGKATSDAAA
jgi:hypothetical protein